MGGILSMKKYIRENSPMDYIISSLPFVILVILCSLGYILTGTL